MLGGRWFVGVVRLAFVLALLCRASPALSDSANSHPTGVSLRVHRPLHVRLNNGLEVVLERDSRAPLVALIVAHDAGSARDPRGHRGLAHLVEHLTFRGSRHLLPDGSYAALDGAGVVRWNGSTTSDLTASYAVVPSAEHRLPLADHLATLFADGQPASAYSGLRARIARVTAGEVRRAARTWLCRGCTQIVVLAEASLGVAALQDFGRVEWYRLSSRVTGARAPPPH